MTTTAPTGPRQATSATTSSTAEDPRPAPPRLRRRPAVAAIGVALIAFGALGAAALAAAASTTTDVVAVAATVPRGQQIGPGDLVTVAVTPGQGLHTVPAADKGTLVGQRAAWDMLAGTLVTPESVTDTPVPGPGQSLVGLALTTGQLPSVDLRPGDTVVVVGTPRQQDDPAELPPLASTRATIAAITTPDTAGVTILNVAVPGGAAEELAARAATGRIAVILAGPDPGQG